VAVQADPRILSPAAQSDPRTVGLARQPNPTYFCSVLGLVERDPTLWGPGGQQDLMLVVLFRNVLGLVWQSYPIVLGLATNSDPIVFDRENNALSPNC
jgi:hypothetical protein